MTSRKRRAELLGKALDILIEQPGGLPASVVLERISQRNGLSEDELHRNSSHPMRRFEELIWMGTIAPAKAGWLQNDPEHWMLTDQGKQAYQSCACPEDFTTRAAIRSPQGWMSVYCPETYSFITRTADRLLVESKLLRRIGSRELLAKAFGVKQSLEDVLPLQAAQRYTIPLKLKGSDDLIDYLNSAEANFFEGGHAI